MKFTITFRANRLHDPDRIRINVIKEIEADDKLSAFSSLYHKYEHIDNVQIYNMDEVPDE